MTLKYKADERWEFIIENIGVVKSAVQNKYPNLSKEVFDELVSEAYIIAYEAFDTYDKEQGTEVSTYIYQSITWRLTRVYNRIVKSKYMRFNTDMLDKQKRVYVDVCEGKDFEKSLKEHSTSKRAYNTIQALIFENSHLLTELDKTVRYPDGSFIERHMEIPSYVNVEEYVVRKVDTERLLEEIEKVCEKGSTPRHKEWLYRLLIEGETYANIAREYGVSRQAVNKGLKPYMDILRGQGKYQLVG